MEKTFSPKEASLFVGCSEYTIRQMAREKRIPHYRVGKCIRFREVSLVKWMERQEKNNYIKD